MMFVDHLDVLGGSLLGYELSEARWRITPRPERSLGTLSASPDYRIFHYNLQSKLTVSFPPRFCKHLTFLDLLHTNMATNDPAPFQSIPWVSTLLKDTSFVTFTIPSRTNKASTEDSLFSKTLNSETTLSACLSQYRPPQNTTKSTSYSPQSPTKTPLAEELRLFFILGSDLNGYPRILHGGIVAALLDEATGLLLSINGHIGDASTREAKDAQPGPVTAYLNTKFLRPVSTPGAIVVQARMIEVKEDRKWRVEGVIRDGEGVALAQAEALHIKPRAKM